MLVSDSEELVRQIHASSTRIVLAVTGGGSGAIAALFQVPGASKSMLLAAVPYADTALTEWLGARPLSFCSDDTARAMAMAAYQRARQLDPDATALLGVACTASLASDREKRGPHRFYIATQTAETTTCVHVELTKGARSRLEEERFVATAILNQIAECCEVSARLPIDRTSAENPVIQHCAAPIAWRALLAGEITRVEIGTASSPPFGILPGAFHPIHQGHRKMAEVAERILGQRIAYEISIVNVDKPPLDFVEIAERTEQFSTDDTVWLTRAPTFAEKAVLFPGCTFVVGADTIERIAEPRYYEGNVASMLRAIEQIAMTGCRFLVFGRLFEGRFQSLEDLSLPPSLRVLCTEVPESQFREDISSTELRAREQQ